MKLTSELPTFFKLSDLIDILAFTPFLAKEATEDPIIVPEKVITVKYEYYIKFLSPFHRFHLQSGGQA